MVEARTCVKPSGYKNACTKSTLQTEMETPGKSTKHKKNCVHMRRKAMRAT